MAWGVLYNYFLFSWIFGFIDILSKVRKVLEPAEWHCAAFQLKMIF